MRVGFHVVGSTRFAIIRTGQGHPRGRPEHRCQSIIAQASSGRRPPAFPIWHQHSMACQSVDDGASSDAAGAICKVLPLNAHETFARVKGTGRWRMRRKRMVTPSKRAL